MHVVDEVVPEVVAPEQGDLAQEEIGLRVLADAGEVRRFVVAGHDPAVRDPAALVADRHREEDAALVRSNSALNISCLSTIGWQ